MILNNRYELDPNNDLLGRGAFGRVFLATDRTTGQKVALKVMGKDKFIDSYNPQVEFNRARYFNHPNIVRNLDGFEFEMKDSLGSNEAVYVTVMEYIGGGNLKDLLQTKLTQEQKHKIIIDVLEGLRYIHNNRILHLDLKPDNILIQKEKDGSIVPKISDFGISKQLKDDYEYIYAVPGTTEYMSPEQLNLAGEGKVSRKSDLWSVGILIYEIFLGSTPFVDKTKNASSKSQVINALLTKKKPEGTSSLPSGFRTLVEKCLQHDPKKRTNSVEEALRLVPPIKKPKSNPPTKTKSQQINQENKRKPSWFLPFIGVSALAAFLLFQTVSSWFSGSSEIQTVFLSLDKGNLENISNITTQLDQTIDALYNSLAEESKVKYTPMEPAIDEIRIVVSDFNEYISITRDEIVDRGGNHNGMIDDGDFIESYGKVVPKGRKDNKIINSFLVKQGRGDSLKEMIFETRDRLITIYSKLLDDHGEEFGLSKAEIESNKKKISRNIPLGIDDVTWRTTDSKSWADFKFSGLSVAAALPVLSMIQSRAINSEAFVINDLTKFIGGEVIKFDAFFPVVEAKKAYVIRGEPFEARISIGAYSSQIDPGDIGIYVNGNKQTVGKDGTATFKITNSTIGRKKINLRAVLNNPLTGEVTESESVYEYEVGERSIMVFPEKMNVFYVGVDNPISVSAVGISTGDLKVSISGAGGEIKKVGSNNYVVNVSQVGECKIKVSGGGLIDSRTFRVKRIPNPEARLGRNNGGTIGVGEFKAQAGVLAILENFDFDARCAVAQFEMVYIAPRTDAVLTKNNGARFNSKSSRLKNMAKPGDTYYFRDVRAKCPGDTATRKINDMVFNIR